MPRVTGDDASSLTSCIGHQLEDHRICINRFHTGATHPRPAVELSGDKTSNRTVPTRDALNVLCECGRLRTALSLGVFIITEWWRHFWSMC